MTGVPGSAVKTVNLVGVGHWCQHLARLIESVEPDIEVSVLRTRELLRNGRKGTTVRVGYRPGARTWRGRAFDLLYSLSVPPTRRRTYWIGSDVAHATSDVPIGTIQRKWRAYGGGRHACGAPWFVDELRTIGIESTYLRFPHQPVPPKSRTWPVEFSASVYVPANNSSAYGSLMLPTLADRTPDIVYRVYGGGVVEQRPNIRQVGYVDNPVEEVEKSVVHLRLTEHDGIAGTVREALAIGRYVVFGYDVPGVIRTDIRDPLRIAEIVESFRADFVAGTLAPNEVGVEYAHAMNAEHDAQALADWMAAR